MNLTAEGEATTLEGPVPDQPALFGLLNKVRDLGLEVLSVERLDAWPRPGAVPDRVH